MHFRIAAAVATILTASLTYSHTGTSITGTTSSSQLRSYTKAPTAKTRIKTSVEEFAFWFDEAKWKQEKSDNPHLLNFKHVNGEAGALIVSGGIGVPTTVLRDNLLKSGRETDPNAQITHEEKRTVNGRQVLALEISTTIDGESYKFLGYFHGGASGSIAVIGIIPEAVFAKNIGELTEFLNGLEISEQELPTSASREVISNKDNLSVNPKVRIEYDPQKWTQAKTTGIATFLFTHSSGDGYVKIISGRLSPPFDSLPDIVLSNLQEDDTSARIVFKEKRRVNGADVWFLKMEAEVNKLPIVLCGYYYAGKNGTVQVVTITGKSLFSDFEKDFMDFLNGLWISE